MPAKLNKRAFSITELMLVVSGLGLLATFVLPLPQRLQQRQRLTGCLENLARIGAASLAYAAEDPRHQIVPLHPANVTTLHGLGWVGAWGWRTALPRAFGGQTATTAFPVEGGEVTVMLDSYWAGAPNPWGAATRPLNSFVEAAGGNLQSFQCPADTGYPAAVTEWSSPDVPPPAAGIPCFEMLGNSYRVNSAGVVYIWGESCISATLCAGSLGHAPDYILEPSRVAMYSDPLFYSLVRQASDPEPVDPIVGWHGALMADNVVYCDGSARLTEIGTLRQFSAQELHDMFFWEAHESQAGMFLRRGSSWQMDCYPAPGALIATYTAPGPPLVPPAGYGWPYERYTINENPYGPGRDRGQKPDPVAPELQQGRWVSQ